MDGDARPLEMFEGSEGATCALPTDALRERLELLGRLGGENRLESRTEGDRHVVVFRASPAVRDALERIVAAEAECCSFLDLTITEERGAGEEPDRLVLTVAAPPEGALVAAGFAAAFDPA
jgi:hypothetical protein